MIFAIRCAITKIAAVTGIAALGLGLGASAASAASAAATVKPVVIYNDSNGWAAPTGKASHSYIGEGGAPIVYKLKCEVPRAFRTVHPLGWATWKGEFLAPTEEELLTGIQGRGREDGDRDVASDRQSSEGARDQRRYPR